MSWIKKITDKKSNPGPAKKSSRRTVNDENLDLFGDDPAVILPTIPPQTMVSELARDPDNSTDLSYDLEITGSLSPGDPSEESINLDLYDSSDPQQIAVDDIQSTTSPRSDSGNLPLSEQIDVIDPMAGDFDLDLGESDPPPSIEESFDAAVPQPGVEEDPSSLKQSASVEDSILSATASGEDYLGQLATSNLEQSGTPSSPQAIEPVPADDFDATVITTVGDPSIIDEANYVVGWLVVIEGAGKGQARPIQSGINTIGRAPDQTIPLYFGSNSDGEISRRDHTRIIYDTRSNDFKLIHGASRNLTYLNDESVLEITVLKAYDRIGIGKTTLLFLPLC